MYSGHHQLANVHQYRTTLLPDVVLPLTPSLAGCPPLTARSSTPPIHPRTRPRTYAAYEEKQHGPPGLKLFVRLVTSILVDEQRERDRQRLEQLNLKQDVLQET